MSGVGLFCCMGVGFVVAEVDDEEAMDLQQGCLIKKLQREKGWKWCKGTTWVVLFIVLIPYRIRYFN